MLESRQISSMFVSVCVTVGLALLASRYRDKVLRSVNRLCRGIAVSVIAARANDNSDKATIVEEDEDNKVANSSRRHHQQRQLVNPNDVILADSVELCEYAVQRIRCNSSDRVLGFDCEWVNEGPVSLLQLATRNGVCALFRLNKIGHIPQGLKELLASRELLKVGVGPDEDGRRVAKDYKCQVLGSVDLRNLANRLGLGQSARGLAGLCLQYLQGVEIDKAPEVRCSDWNAERLAGEQIAYASADAFVSVLIYHEMLKKAREKRTFWESWMAFVKKYLYRIHTRNIDADFFDLPQGVIDARFKISNDSSSPVVKKIINAVDDKNGKFIKINKLSGSSSSNDRRKNSIPARNKPLYQNCYLQAPDGEILCTCDKKKASWYVSKQLGEVVQQDPFTVRLKFEPSGRALGQVGKYYTQIKQNQCVVCGNSDEFVRKNVVPREYRKYFPLVMKSHQSHDILLLCPTCHRDSNIYDLQLRRELAEKCNTPFTAATPHGLKVVECFKNREGGLIELEKMWRQNFLNTMKPKYLPELWSVSHNQERLNIHYSQSRIEPKDAKLAGIKCQ